MGNLPETLDHNIIVITCVKFFANIHVSFIVCNLLSSDHCHLYLTIVQITLLRQTIAHLWLFALYSQFSLFMKVPHNMWKLAIGAGCHFLVKHNTCTQWNPFISQTPLGNWRFVLHVYTCREVSLTHDHDQGLLILCIHAYYNYALPTLTVSFIKGIEIRVSSKRGTVPLYVPKGRPMLSFKMELHASFYVYDKRRHI